MATKEHPLPAEGLQPDRYCILEKESVHLASEFSTLVENHMPKYIYGHITQVTDSRNGCLKDS